MWQLTAEKMAWTRTAQILPTLTELYQQTKDFYEVVPGKHRFLLTTAAGRPQHQVILADDDLIAIDARLKTLVHTVERNPYQDPHLVHTAGTPCPWIGHALRLTVDLWQQEANSYVWDTTGTMLSKWNRVYLSPTGETLSIESTFYSAICIDGTPIVLRQREQHVSCASTKAQEERYPGIVNALVVAQSLELSEDLQAQYCLAQSLNNAFTSNAVLPPDMCS